MNEKEFPILAAILILALGVISILYPELGSAILIITALSVASLIVFRRYTDEKNFLTSLFLVALAARLAFGIFVHLLDLRDFFGGDAITYDNNGWILAQYWSGQIGAGDFAVEKAIATNGSGWGMNYLVGGLYYLLGRNILAAQSLCAVFGAATAPMVYYCAVNLFSNKRVAKISAFTIALFPSFIIWSSQLMKDGLIIFLLVLAMTMVMQLQKKFNYAALLLLIFSMGGIISLRFYIFYMVAAAVAGSFLVGLNSTPQSILRRSLILVILGLGLTYLGVIRNANVTYERFGNLERIQASREDLARSAESGYGEDLDVSTTSGAISAIPIGFAYLMLAPFPWQVENFRQAITLPEVLIWWAMIPFMIAGLWYSIRHKLRNTVPILIFSIMLTLAYSIFQGNVGTAYRQRTQIQVFLFIFIAVGWTLFKENRENKALEIRSRKKIVDERMRAGNPI